jgi:hypothetical protein
LSIKEIPAKGVILFEICCILNHLKIHIGCAVTPSLVKIFQMAKRYKCLFDNASLVFGEK